MSTERHADLKQQCYEQREVIRRLEEEIRKLEKKIYTPKEANETSEPSKDKKSSREPRKHTTASHLQYQLLHTTTRRNKFDLLKKDPQIKEVLTKFILQSRFMPVKTVTSRLRSLTLYLLFGISIDDALF